jgi:hypothetical protein
MDYRNNPAAAPYRGIRNNNPGNFKADGTGWQGNVGSDGTFYIFADDTWGLRALAKDLQTKIGSDGLDTITTLITKYAPPSENDTQAYINSVASDSGIGADDQLGTDQDTITSLMRAIVNHENGDTASAQFVSDADLAQGFALANDPTTVFKAAVIAAQSNPVETVAIVAGVAVLLWFIFDHERKK